MKKLLALILVLMMVLSGTFAAFASAESAYIKLTVDRDVAKTLMESYGMEEDDLAMADVVISVVNALGINVIPADDGAQIDVDFAGNEAASFAFGTDDEGIVIASTLFPNYVVTMKYETLQELSEQASASVSIGGEDGLSTEDIAQLTEVFGGYISEFAEACGEAAQVGEPVTGEYVFDEYTFDTMTPVAVDIDVIVKATEDLFNKIGNDETAMATLNSFAKDDNDEPLTAEDLQEVVDVMKEYFPDEASAEVYTNSDGSGALYVYSEASYEGKEDSSFEFYMLIEEEGDGYFDFVCCEDPEFDIFAWFGEDYMGASFTADGVYFAISAGFGDDFFDCDVYFQDEETPVLCVSVTLSDEGEVTLSVDKDGKEVVTIEDIMADESGEATSGLLGDIMTNGLEGAMNALFEAVPEVAALMGA